MTIEKALKELAKLFEKWDLSLDNWCVIGEWAFILQGWNIPERKNILDVYVDRDKLPWPVKRERQAVPPKNSTELEDWIDFTEKTGFGLDIVPIPESPTDPRSRTSIKRGSVVYQLPDGNKLRVNTPLAEVEIHRWLFKQYTAEDVGEENIKRWWEYIENIKQTAMKKEDKKVLEACDKLLEKYKS